MKTSPSPALWLVKQPVSECPRQLCLTFETPVLLAATPEQRATAIQALAAMFVQAAGLDDPEDDDVQP